MEGLSRCRGILPWAFAATLMCGLFWTSIGLAEIWEPGQEGSAPSASGSLSPVNLPRTTPAPVTLAMQFSSPPVGGETRVTERIDFELSPRVTFGFHGLQSCDDDTLTRPPWTHVGPAQARWWDTVLSPPKYFHNTARSQ